MDKLPQSDAVTLGYGYLTPKQAASEACWEKRRAAYLLGWRDGRAQELKRLEQYADSLIRPGNVLSNDGEEE